MSDNKCLFSTKLLERKLFYFGYRFYDPAISRWTTRDPAGEDSNPLLYSFIFNNPMVSYDILGLTTPLDENEIKACENNIVRARSIVRKIFRENSDCQCFFDNTRYCNKDNLQSRLDSLSIKIDNESNMCISRGSTTWGWTYDTDGKWEVYICPTTCRFGRWCLAAVIIHELYHECEPGVKDTTPEGDGDTSAKTFQAERKCGLGRQCSGD